MRSKPPKIDFSREEAAEREIGRTAVSPFVQRLLVAVFLLTIAGVPAIQWLSDASQAAPQSKRSSWIPRATDVFSAFPNAWRAGSEQSSPYARAKAANASLKHDFQSFEKSLEENSFLSRHALPPVQYFTARFLGLGNEKVYLGREGWLFYRPDVDYVAGPGFLAPSELRVRAKSGGIQPDPLPALVRFRDDLAARGIRLLVVPVPVKPSLDPEFLSSRYLSRRQPLQNPSFPDFLAALQKSGIDVLDVAPAIAEAKFETGLPPFLKTDTHWTPATMERVAALIAKKAVSVGFLQPMSTAFRRAPAIPIANTGDLAQMLRLAPGSTLYPPETATISPVIREDDSPWQSDTSAEILLLGDSFTNIYSSEDLKWGTGAGLAEHVSLALQRPLDRIAINAGGASTTRQSLARSPERLVGKRLVILEFAARDLASVDWRVIPLPSPVAATERTDPPPATAANKAPTISGVIRAISRAPRPGSLPYRDLIICIHLGEVKGIAATEILVFTYGMRDNVHTPANSLNSGDTLTFQAIPWNQAEETFGTINRIELDGPAAEIGEIFWTQNPSPENNPTLSAPEEAPRP